MLLKRVRETYRRRNLLLSFLPLLWILKDENIVRITHFTYNIPVILDPAMLAAGYMMKRVDVGCHDFVRSDANYRP